MCLTSTPVHNMADLPGIKLNMHIRYTFTCRLASAHSLDDRHGPHEEEEVVYERLPSDIASRHVLLMDPLVGTGRTACRAVEVSSEQERRRVQRLSTYAEPPPEPLYGILSVTLSAQVCACEQRTHVSRAALLAACVIIAGLQGLL